MSEIAGIITESCLPDIYAAARERFDHVYRRARAYCTNREPCDLATSQLGLTLWTKLQGRLYFVLFSKFSFIETQTSGT